MSNENENQNPNANEKENTPIDEVDKFLNSTEPFLRLPKRDGESVTYQFLNDKSKRERPGDR
jgi:hypothetical protein